MNKALEEAQKSEHKFSLGAVLFKGPRIFGSGYNSNRYVSTMPEKYRKFRNSYHAEIAAIQNTQNWEKLKGSSLLVIRINKSGSLCNAFPCEYCQESLKHLGVKWIYYSNKYGEIKREKL